MNRQQEAIWSYLVSHSLGASNAIHISDLANELNIPPQGTNNDNVRGWITSLVKNYHKQIGTCENGVFIILTNEELDAAARFVERNTRSTAIRQNGLYNP